MRHQTFLFGDSRIATASTGRGEFRHTFGGPHDRAGASREDCNGILIHLLHRFDLSDPAIPFVIPDRRWLPLYYCFDFRANELGYRLSSDEAMTVFFPDDDPNVSEHESWPGDNYPLEFPKSHIIIEEFPFDPSDLDDAYQWAGIFGIDKLSRRHQLAAKKRVTKEMNGLGLHVPTTDEGFHEALHNPFPQGKPASPCLNPKCSNHETKGALTTISLMPAEPVMGVCTFGEWSGGVLLIFQICPKCYTIRVCNQCD